MGNWDFVWDLRISVARSCSFSWPSLATPTGHELALTEDRAGPGSLRGASPGRARHGDAPRGFCNARLPDGSREQWWATLGRSCFGLDPRHSRAVIVSVKPRVTKSSTPATVTIPLTRPGRRRRTGLAGGGALASFTSQRGAFGSMRGLLEGIGARPRS